MAYHITKFSKFYWSHVPKAANEEKCANNFYQSVQIQGREGENWKTVVKLFVLHANTKNGVPYAKYTFKKTEKSLTSLNVHLKGNAKSLSMEI